MQAMDALFFVAFDLAGQFQGDLDTLFMGLPGMVLISPSSG